MKTEDLKNMTEISFDFTSHKTMIISLATVGAILNSVGITAVVKGGLYSQKSFAFVLNLFVSNFLMSAVGLPVYILPTFLETSSYDDICSILGFIVFSLSGTCLYSMLLISLNHYILIVHFRKYDVIYSVRNTRIILILSWIIPQLLNIPPATGLWSRFTFNRVTLNCTPMKSDDSYKHFVGILTFLITFPVFSFCYIEIARKALSRRFRVTTEEQRNNSQRQIDQRQLMRSILLIITIFSSINIPYFVLSNVDPKKEKVPLQIHSFALYLGTSNFFINTLVFLTTNRQLNTSLRKMFGKGK